MPLLDLVPVISAIMGIAGISFKAGMILQKLDTVVEDVKGIKTELKEHNKEITGIKFTIADIEKRLAVA